MGTGKHTGDDKEVTCPIGQLDTLEKVKWDSYINIFGNEIQYKYVVMFGVHFSLFHPMDIP
jgi:hypothetical protein